MSLKANLTQAKRNKKDEFYTQLKDIENELRHYKDHFKGKTVYCNADDPRVSNFFHYFSYNFEHLGLKKLITTCYKNQEMDLFSMHDYESAIALVYEGEKDNGRVPTVENIGVIELRGDGDFRSPEAIEFLKEADIVVTNPPFSLFREYVAQLIEYDKDFIIVGHQNAITYKEIFPYLKDNKMWIGRTNFNVGMYFYVPDDYEQYHKIENGRKMVRVSTSCWYTNLEHNKRNEQLVLTKFYEGNEDKYPYYDNYNAIEVGTYKDIPMDYDGVMGVPITFIDKYNPEQFEILGSDNYDGTPPTKKYGKKKRVSAFLFKSC
ncbi:adenine-specific methyltransferase EcoRI family protein (plasmid) [Enterococcus dispar]|uniref:adenine-specific methyltransferase EcoRI family protein n=1 Tax=Enterococcus dispar TaxID=44009 RepID=UPI00232D28A9|nr:adenine-specific methyltransferase EcoRI family protein [Enterococcus dispar]WCG34454.1 adenine-specific methyltransferase EcoRI family protein [Enterococcus dispar]